jgi:hypothetical protein
MNEKTIIAGQEVCVSSAGWIFEKSTLSVRRVIEEMAMAGHGPAAIDLAAKTTARAVVSALSWMMGED